RFRPMQIAVRFVFPFRIDSGEALRLAVVQPQLGFAHGLFAGHWVLVLFERRPRLGDRVHQKEILHAARIALLDGEVLRIGRPKHVRPRRAVRIGRRRRGILRLLDAILLRRLRLPVLLLLLVLILVLILILLLTLLLLLSPAEAAPRKAVVLRAVFGD